MASAPHSDASGLQLRHCLYLLLTTTSAWASSRLFNASFFQQTSPLTKVVTLEELVPFDNLSGHYAFCKEPHLAAL